MDYTTAPTTIRGSTRPAARADRELAGIFRERVPVGAPADEAALEATLRRLLEEGARAWPGLQLAPGSFVRHLAARAVGGAPPSAARAPDLYLACACAAGIPGAFEAFDRAHLDVVGAYLVRMRPSA